MNPSSTSRQRGTRSSRRSKPEPTAPRFTGKYLSLTTFRRDGTGVATPVWFVTEAGKIFIATDAGSYKVRRIRRNPSVTVAECTASGRLRSAHVPGRARILPPGETPHAEALMASKYRLDRILILPLYRAVQAISSGRRTNSESVVLVITPGTTDPTGMGSRGVSLGPSLMALSGRRKASLGTGGLIVVVVDFGGGPRLP